MAERPAAEDPTVDFQLQETEETEHRRELFLFDHIATITAHTLDLQEIIDAVLVAVLDFFRIDSGLLLLWDQEEQRLIYAASRGFPAAYLDEISRGRLEHVVGPNLFSVNRPILIRDIHKDPRLLPATFTQLIQQEKRISAVVSIPLKYREELIGFLNLAAAHDQPFRNVRQYFLSILGNQIALAIENARLYHELRRSEHRYRRIFEGSKDMIFVTDAGGKLLDLNPAGVELLKFASQDEALSLSHFREVFQNAREWDRFQHLAATHGFVRDMELTMLTQGDKNVPVLLSGIARLDQEGQVAGYEGIVKDITERKRGEWEIFREKQTTEGIIEGLPVPTFVIGRDHRISYWNKACEELTGFSREEVVGTYRHFQPFYSQDRPSLASLVMEQNIKALQKYFGDKHLKPSPNLPGAYEAYEYLPKFRGKEERYFFHTASPIYDESGRIQGAVQVILDITERERLAGELQDSEKKFRRLVESSLEGIALHHKMKLAYVNQACLEMFHYQDPGEMLGRSLLKFVDPVYHQAMSRWLGQLQRGVPRPRIFEVKGVRKDGSKFDLEVVSFPTTYEGKAAIQTHIRDITHKKQLEEHLSRTEKLAALGQLAAGLAHEINNPLGGILVYAYLLLEDLELDRPERTQVEKIVREATRCKDIIQGLLEFSRHMPFKMVPLNINAVLEEVFYLLQDHLLFQNIKLTKNFQPNLPPVLGDKSRLEGVFINLTVNSGEAMKGEGKLTVSTGVGPRGDHLLICFADTGPGIPEGLLSRLFDPFFTTKEVGKGVGLGLSVSYGIVQKHLGRIYVEQTGPQGSIFVVELPIYREIADSAGRRKA